MKKVLVFLLSFFTSTVLYCQAKQIAITVDDVPFAYDHKLSIDEVEQATLRLLDKLNKYDITATGFINGIQIVNSKNPDRQKRLLNVWLEKGHDLGNHTYSHLSFNSTALDDYIDDFSKNEIVLQQLYLNKQRAGKHFRYPYLQMGPDTIRKNGFQQYLKSIGYRIAPVTIENSDYIFNEVYVEAYLKDDKITMQKAVEAYLKYLREILSCYEQLTIEVVGRPIKHIFLCHANLINADCFDKVADVFREEGYTFVGLNEALEDSIYQQTDTLTISGGWSHIDRWKRNGRIKTAVTYPKIDEEIMGYYNNKQ